MGMYYLSFLLFLLLINIGLSKQRSLDSVVSNQHHHYLKNLNTTSLSLHIHKELQSLEIKHYEAKCAEENDCLFAKYVLPQITINLLDNVLNHVNSSIKYILIHSEEQLFEEITNNLDNCISRYPWWIVRVVEFPTYAKLGQRLTYEEMHTVPTQSMILLQRVHPELETELKFMIQRHFPPEEECKKRIMEVSNEDGDTWGNRLYNLGMRSIHYPMSVFTIHSTRTGLVASESPFAASDECVDLVNKWECLFLTTTNCTLPKLISECPDRKCVHTDVAYFSSASADGKLISDEEARKMFTDMESKKFPYYRFNDKMIEYPGHTNVAFELTDPYTITPETTRTSPFECNVDTTKYIFGIYTRFDSDFRMEIQNLVDDFRYNQEPKFTPSMSCTAIHIRKDDRVLKDTDMIEWCLNHTKLSSDGSGYTHTGLNRFGSGEISLGEWHDMGCSMVMPYGAASLMHFINASLIIEPEEKNLFIMTDDKEWLKHEMAHFHHIKHTDARLRNLNIFTFPAREKHRTQHDSIVSAEFWASMAIATQCSSLVGYVHASAAANIIYRYMCFYHNFKFLACPKLYTFRSSRRVPGRPYQ